MSANPAWRPISFTPEVERAYAVHRSKQILPLIRLGSVIGAASFAGYQLWDLLLDPDAFTKTGPIRLANILLFAVALGISFTQPIKNSPRILLTVMVLIYIGVAIGFALVLAQLPGGFVAGVSGFILGMIFIPVFEKSDLVSRW